MFDNVIHMKTLKLKTFIILDFISMRKCTWQDQNSLE